MLARRSVKGPIRIHLLVDLINPMLVLFRTWTRHLSCTCWMDEWLSAWDPAIPWLAQLYRINILRCSWSGRAPFFFFFYPNQSTTHPSYWIGFLCPNCPQRSIQCTKKCKGNLLQIRTRKLSQALWGGWQERKIYLGLCQVTSPPLDFGPKTIACCVHAFTKVAPF